jgi:hypothetical protein
MIDIKILTRTAREYLEDGVKKKKGGEQKKRSSTVSFTRHLTSCFVHAKTKIRKKKKVGEGDFPCLIFFRKTKLGCKGSVV